MVNCILTFWYSYDIAVVYDYGKLSCYNLYISIDLDVLSNACVKSIKVTYSFYFLLNYSYI